VAVARRRQGSNERAARRSVRALGELSGVQPALAESAFTLARALDEGAGLATAAVARELRATLEALAKGSDDDSDPALAALLGRLSSPLGNSPS